MRNKTEVTTTLLGKIAEVITGQMHQGDRGVIVCMFPATTHTVSENHGCNPHLHPSTTSTRFEVYMMVYLQLDDGRLSEPLELNQLAIRDSLEREPEEDSGE